VTVRKFLTGILVKPARNENVGVPADPEIKIADVLMSCENDCPPLSIKKFEFDGFRPFSVKATAITLPDAAVFCINSDFVTNSNVYDFVCPNVTFDAVTNGTGEI